MKTPGQGARHLPTGLASGPSGWTRPGSSLGRFLPDPHVALLSGQAALAHLALLDEVQASELLSVCAAALSLYPAWERQTWMMPDSDAVVSVYGGHFLALEGVVARLGRVRHLSERQRFLHVPSGLTFAAYQSALGIVTLLLGGVNSSDSDSEVQTFSAEIKQLEASVSSLLGRVPKLYRAADLLTVLTRDELPGALMISGHSLGGGLAHYAGLMNGLKVQAFSPAALGRGLLALLLRRGKLADAPHLLEQVQSCSLEGDPIPLIGSHWLQSEVVGLHLRLPLSPGVSPARHATTHGQIYPHLLAHLQQHWPQLPSALGRA